MGTPNGMGNEGLQDPLQGYDIKVSTASASGQGGTNQLVGAFTSLMFKIVNQTETYLPLNSRIPRMLDGEVIVVWSLEQGLVEMSVVANTFGGSFADSFAKGRAYKIPRSSRFDIDFKMNAMIEQSATAVAGASAAVWEVGTAATGGPGFIPADRAAANTDGYSIKLCRVDTFSFGVAAGRHVVANAWQGTGQHLVKLGT